MHGSRKAWRTRRLSATHYHNPAEQTDQFESAIHHTPKRRNGAPAIHVVVYDRGRPGWPWITFEVPPYAMERLAKPGIKPKTVPLCGGKLKRFVAPAARNGRSMRCRLHHAIRDADADANILFRTLLQLLEDVRSARHCRAAKHCVAGRIAVAGGRRQHRHRVATKNNHT